MKNVKKFVVIFASIFAIHTAVAQDPTFSQFYANPLYLNPAFAGSHGCPRFNLNYRNEWPNLSGNYKTYSASYDQHFKNISGGIGFIAMHDNQGVGTIETTTIGLIYSYQLKVTRKFSVRFGAKAGYFFKTLDNSKLTFNDMIDPRKGFIYSSKDPAAMQSEPFSSNSFDAGAGVLGFSKSFFFGFSAHHLTRPKESFLNGNATIPIRFTGHMGAEIRLGSKSKFENQTSIMPNIIYQYQNGFQEINIGTYVRYSSFTFGAWLRNKDAFILSLGINTGSFRIGYSYDITVSKLNNRDSGGSHEVSLGLNLNCKSKPKAFKTISCPSF